MKRRDILKLSALNVLLFLVLAPSRLLAFSAARMRRARVALLGPLRTTQAIMMVAGKNTSQNLRTTQAVMMVTGKNNSQNLRTTQAIMLVLGK